MKDAKYSQWDYAKGPFITRAGMTKGSTKRVKTIAFIKPDPWRDMALKDPSEIDLDVTPIDSIIAWMDGEKAISLRIDEYARMKAAICGNNWELVLRFMRENPDNIFTQIYGLYSFSKSEIRLDIPEPGTHGNIMVDFVSTILESHLFSTLHTLYAFKLCLWLVRRRGAEDMHQDSTNERKIYCGLGYFESIRPSCDEEHSLE